MRVARGTRNEDTPSTLKEGGRRAKDWRRAGTITTKILLRRCSSLAQETGKQPWYAEENDADVNRWRPQAARWSHDHERVIKMKSMISLLPTL